ncbi:MAG: hypothetical protein ACKO66_08560, partial [Flavobacteriales bacterium]
MKPTQSWKKLRNLLEDGTQIGGLPVFFKKALAKFNPCSDTLHLAPNGSAVDGGNRIQNTFGMR